MEITEAVRELRARLGDTQQAFANRLNLTIRSIASYEKNRIPTGNVLRIMAKVAEQAGFNDLARVFRQGLADDIGSWDPGDLNLVLEPQTPAEKLWVSAILAVLRNEQYASLMPELAKLLREPTQRSIEMLETHKKRIKFTKQTLALLDQDRPVDEIAKALGVPLQDVRNLAIWREMRLALDQANKWAAETAEEQSQK